MHGGNIYRAAEFLRWPERKIIDFSASINPLGVSKKVKAELRKYLKYLHNYPDPECKRFLRHLSKSLQLPEDALIAGNGSTEFIYLIPMALKPEKVLLPAPTFSEYERALILRGSPVVEHVLLKKENFFRIVVEEFIEKLNHRDIVYICNPNNPTAQYLKREQILQLAEACKATKTFLVVDEAFIDFIPEHTLIDAVLDNTYLLVLRSLTKFYALTGLRIGYLAAHPDIIKKFKEHKEPWTVNTLAQRAAVVAIKDKNYKKETFRVLGQEKTYLERELQKLGITFYPSEINFYLIEHPHSVNIVEKMKKKGILIRHCGNFRGLNDEFFRIAVKSHRENALLIKNLKNILCEL